MIRSFLRSQDGNFATTLAVAILPVTMAAGIAVDYSMASRFKTRLQAAVDAATLAASVDLAKLSNREAKIVVSNFLRENLSPSDFAQIAGDPKVRIDRKALKLTVDVDADYPTAFGRVIGIKSIDYGATASTNASWGGIEVALVLDNTGSMGADGKLNSLKSAARDFVDDMMLLNAQSNRVKIGIVPFGQYVNVGMDNRGANWMSVPADTSKQVCGERRDVIAKSGCTTQNGAGSNDGASYGYTYETCTSYTYGPPYQSCWTEEVRWYGCAGSRSHPRNLLDGQYGTRIPGAMNVRCPARVTELTHNKAKLLQEIDAMTPEGETYIPSGLIWGQRLISSIAPFREGVTPAAAEQNSIKKAIVLMTDGQNTRSKNTSSEYHDGGDSAEANDWTSQLCGSIKAEGIAVYTVTFGSSVDQATRSLMAGCASEPQNYFDAADAAALTAAFADISASLTKLYLSQ